METTVIDFILSTLAQLSAQYPDAAWIITALSVLMTVCGLCAVATVWMPVPKETTGAYAAVYRWVHAFAAHFGQNKGKFLNSVSIRIFIRVLLWHIGQLTQLVSFIKITP